MFRPADHHRLHFAALGWCAVWLAGCNSLRVPHFDLSAHHAPAPPPPVRRTAEPAPPGRHDTSRIELTPSKVIAPVGCEVVMLAGICDGDGYLRARERVEWLLEPGGTGQFLAVGRQSPLDWISGFSTWPRKVDNTYAIGATSSRNLCLTRGTPTPTDDLPVDRGQAWIAVTSPVEGVSHVTAYAPGVAAWDSNRQTATIYWVDAAFAYPPPAINPAGTRHTFTTIVTRHTSHAPIAGWRVRYQITGGPPAGFTPAGAQTIEVATNDLGQASAEIEQLGSQPGTNTVSIQVIRPADAAGEAFVAGNGATSKTWSAPAISLKKSGPSQGVVGQMLLYRIDVSNPGSLAANDVTVDDLLPEGLSFVDCTPTATPTEGRLQWRLGSLAGGERRTIDVRLRADRPGTVNNCATVTTAEKLTAQDCAATTIVAPALRVSVTGPVQATVGEQAKFNVQVTNDGTAAANGLIIVDRFDAGLQHASNPPNRAIERTLGDLAPGQTTSFAVTLEVTQPGKLCNTAEVHGANGLLASGQACLTAAAEATGGAAGAAPPKLTVTKDGPPRKEVDELAEFVITVKNDGDVPATGITVTDHYDPALQADSATENYRPQGEDLIWTIDALQPGEDSRLIVVCRCLDPADNTCNRVTVVSPEGARAQAEACLQVTPRGSGVVATIAEDRDPVAVGNETTFSIHVENRGAAPATRVAVAITLPDELAAVADGAKGPTKETISGQAVRFAPVARLAAGQALDFQVRASAVAAGSGVAEVQVTTQGAKQPIVAQETTVVVGP